MNRKYYIANAILWASAIIASAILEAPTALTLILLPSLATFALVVTRPNAPASECQM
jgi:hypothetical protein